MPANWASVTKSGTTQAASKATAAPKERKQQQKPGPKNTHAASISVPHINPDIEQSLLKIGRLAINVVERRQDIKLPLYIPDDPVYWKNQLNQRRLRKKARRDRSNGIVAAASSTKPQPTPAGKPEEAARLPESEAESALASAPAPKPKPSSWAQLVKDRLPPPRSNPATSVSKPGTNGVANTTGAGGQGGGAKAGGFKSLEEALENWSVAFDAPPVQPRGLVNTGNMCFMNVVLQALLYCAPFYNMLWSIKANVAFSFNTTTPLLEALIQYVHEFKQDRTPLAQLASELNEPFVPENVYEALRKKNVFQTLRGQQEDAQEFMSFLVDGIHEEMASILELYQAKQHGAVATASGAGAGAPTDGDGWLEVGHQNRASVVRDGGASIKTPISQIFGGSLRSTLSIPGAALAGINSGAIARTPQSSNREPFQWLALDISSDNVESVEDAFDEFVAPEVIEGYMPLPGGNAVDATKQVLLESLPPVLMLHLKRFVFCPNEGVQKVHKFIEYPATLTLSPKWFAKGANVAKYRNAKYRLTGVVYHHGSHASGGHYTCDLLRATNEWLRFDDIDIDCLSSVDDALDEKKDRTAYILFYTICH